MRRGEGTLRRTGALALTVTIGAALALAACAGTKPSSRSGQGAQAAQAAHPEVDTGLQTCADCHAQATPEVASQWKASRHGMSLVECFVCHGSTGQDFRARPAASGCAGCHPVQAASVTRGGEAASCFACHPAHALRPQGKTSPHPPQARKG